MLNVFGTNSCQACHSEAIDPTTGEESDLDIDGAGHSGFRASQVNAYDEITGICDDLHDRSGPGFQRRTTGLREVIDPTTGLSWETLGLTSLDQEVGGPFEDFRGEYIPLVSKHGIPVGPRDDRTTNDLFGLGLLDALPDWRLCFLSDPHDRNRDGISGRVHWVVDSHGDTHAGKFGRKAEVAHLDEFNSEAFLNEQGVTTPEHPKDGVVITGKDEETGELIIQSVDDRFPDPELSQPEMDLVNAYVRFLAPPEPQLCTIFRTVRDRGKFLFKKIGCASCHTPTLKTGWSPHKALSWKVIHPYSDMLLHDMGEELAEGCRKDASPSEWRTEPLWGLRFVPAGFMHDGRAETVEEAIQLHGGEASKSRDCFNKLGPTNQRVLLEFLNTL